MVGGTVWGDASGLEVTLAWDANPEPDVVGYRLRHGTQSGSFDTAVDVGNTTSTTLALPSPGTYYIVVTAFNSASLESPASNEIVYNASTVDTEDPVISGIPADIVTAPDSSGGSTAVVSWTEPTASDNVGVASLSGTHSPGDTFSTGTTTVTYTATDAAGNTAVASFTVTVGPAPGYEVTLAWDANPEPDVVGYRLQHGTASGIYDTVIDVGNVTTATIPLPGPGTYYVVVTAQNSAAFESPPSNELVVNGTPNDNVAPTILGTPPDIVVAPASPGSSSANVSWTEPTASDNVGVVSFSSTHAPGSSFTAGTTTVTYTATDAAGNIATADFTVTVGSIDIWRETTFGAQASDPLVAGDLANPDNDRWANLGEYALGLAALLNDGEGAFTQNLDDEEIALHILHNPYLPDVILRVECTEQLGGGNWTSLATLQPGGAWTWNNPALQITSVRVGNLQDVTITEPIGTTASKFYRLVAEKATP